MKESDAPPLHNRGYLLVLLLLFVLFSKCSKDDDVKIDEKPTLIGFSPESGGEGDLITITGSNFSDIRHIQVQFDDRLVHVLSANKNELLVELPQLISTCGEVNIIVYNDTTTLHSKTKFTLACPIIESFTPVRGDYGDIITIHGAYFARYPGRNKITIGDGIAEVISATSTVLNAKLMTGYSGEYPVKIEIESKHGISRGLFTINGPRIAGYSPSAITGCEKVIISGSDFSAVPGENEVFLAP